MKTRDRVAVAALVLVLTGTSGWALLPKRASGIAAAAWTQRNAVDIGFLADMSAHHDQALALAQIALSKGHVGSHAIAMAVFLSQSEEIGRMRGWLQMWGQAELPRSKTMDWMRAESDFEAIAYRALCSQTGGMPGLATSDELNRLRALDGDAFLTYFLQLMTRHHQGAVPMARFASVHASNPIVQALARRIVLDQSEEIARMVMLLKSKNQSPLDTPLGAAPIR